MKEYIICGIQQMGIGVTNLHDSWKWYIDHFGMDCRIFEDNSEAKLMLPYTGGKPRARHAVLAINLQGGGGFEVWQPKGKEPLHIAGEIKLGDLGIIVCKMKVKNIDDAFSFFREKGIVLPGDPGADPSGNKTFFLKDPWGNIFQAVEGHDWFLEERKITGGSYGAIIGVSDIEKAKTVYSDILGYNEVVYDDKGIFPDLAALPGGRTELRRVLLNRSEPLSGPFSRIFGQTVIELISSADRPGKKIYEGRLWGDPGFIHICFDIQGMDKLKEYCAGMGFPFTVDSKASHDGNSFDMGDAAGHFAYLEDPDGTLIEFVETHKIPLIKKLGWYLDLTKRDPHKSLPDWILKTLRFSKVKI
jgi:catechol 2,3-dioxygenase-like lactoylglutathione lyase family enzyme